MRKRKKPLLGIPHRVPSTPCPWCGGECSAADGIEHDDAPGPGSVFICFKCAEIGIFDEGMKLRKLTPKELLEFQLSLSWPGMEAMQRKIRAFWEMMRSESKG